MSETSGPAPTSGDSYKHPKWTTDDLLKHFTELHAQIGLLLAVPIPDGPDPGSEVVTGHQIEALQALGDSGTTMREFARSMNLSSGSATSLADRLVRSGLAQRSFDERDRRVVRMELTPRGREVIDEYTSRQLTILHALGQRFDGEKLIPVSDCALELLSLIAGEPATED